MTQHRRGLFRNGDRWCSKQELDRLEREAELSDDPDAKRALRRARVRCGKPPVKSIIIEGRKWFQKTYGNTYHTSRIIIDDGLEELIVPITHGYGEHYVTTATEKLIRKGVLPKEAGAMPVWIYCRENGIKCEYSSKDVKRKKDLHLGGRTPKRGKRRR